MASAPDDAVIAIRGLAFRHALAERDALDGVSLEIRAGEYVGVLGPDGAGKTTLLLALDGIVPQLVPGELAGSLRVGGLDPSTQPVREMARVVGLVFDDPELAASQHTVAEEVAFGLENLGVAEAEMGPRIADALRAVGLDGLEERSPLTLSGGELQRLAIAAVLAMRPPILVLDEPSSNLDPAGRRAVFDILRRLNREHGITVVVADQDVESLARDATRIVVLDAGRVVADGTPGEMLGQAAAMAEHGVRVPQVTAVVAGLGPGPGAVVPVTLDEAAAWLAARP